MLKDMMAHIWVAIDVPHPVKFTAFDESVQKNIQFQQTAGVLKSDLNLQEKYFLNKNIYFL